MALDPGIPLSIASVKIPSPEEQLRTRREVMSIAAQQVELNSIMKQFQTTQKLRALQQQPGMIDPKTGLPTPEYIAAASGIDANIAANASKLRQDYYKEDAETKWKNIQTAVQQKQFDKDVADTLHTVHVESYRAYKSAHDKAKAAGASPGEQKRQAEEAYLNVVDNAQRENRLPNVSPEALQEIKARPRDIDMVEGILSADTKPSAPDEFERLISKLPLAEREKAIRDRVNVLTTHQPTVTLAYPQQPAAEGEPPKPPAAVTLGPSGKATVQPLPQLEGYGNKPPSTAQSAMTQRFTDRMVTAADLGIKDLQNISQLPVTISSGVFGGRKQGPGLLDATKEVLANKMTSEETQLYNTMAAGIQRNLAAIEATGLMPSGTLQHMMDVMLFKEGDTNLVKASKLAQARQIIEGGLEPILAKPNVPVETKDLIRDMTKKLRQAVPYTQNDVIKLMNSTDPSATLGGFMKGRREGAKGFQGSPDYQKRQKRIQEIDELLKQHEEDSKRVMEAEKKQRIPAKAGFGQSPDGSVTFEPAQ